MAPPVLATLTTKKSFWRRHRKAIIRGVWIGAPLLFLICLLSFLFKDPLTALQRQALRGDYESQMKLGELFWHGGEIRLYLRKRQVPVDLTEAFVYNQMASQTKKGEAMYRVAQMYSDGLGTRQDSSKASAYFDGAFADKGLDKYNSRLEEYGQRCFEGRTVSRNVKRGLEIFDILFDKWTVARQWKHANQLADGFYGEEYQTQSKKYFDLIMSKDKNVEKYAIAYAQRLGQGQGVPKDESEALSQLNRAQSIWSGEKVWEVGIRLGRNDFGESNQRWAIPWLESAVEKEKDKLYDLYEILDKGILGEPDHEKALYYLKMAADEGQDRAIREWERLQEIIEKEKKEAEEKTEPPTVEYTEGSTRYVGTDLVRYLGGFVGYEYNRYSLDDCQRLTRLWRLEKNRPQMLEWFRDEIYSNRLIGIIDACIASNNYRQAARWSALAGEVYQDKSLTDFAELLELFPSPEEFTSPSVFAWEKRLKPNAAQGGWQYAYTLSLFYRARYQYWQDSSHWNATNDESDAEKAKNKANLVKKNSAIAYRKYRDIYMQRRPDPLWLSVPLLGE